MLGKFYIADNEFNKPDDAIDITVTDVVTFTSSNNYQAICCKKETLNGRTVLILFIRTKDTREKFLQQRPKYKNGFQIFRPDRRTIQHALTERAEEKKTYHEFSKALTAQLSLEVEPSNYLVFVAEGK